MILEKQNYKFLLCALILLLFIFTSGCRMIKKITYGDIIFLETKYKHKADFTLKLYCQTPDTRRNDEFHYRTKQTKIIEYTNGLGTLLSGGGGSIKSSVACGKKGRYRISYSVSPTIDSIRVYFSCTTVDDLKLDTTLNFDWDKLPQTIKINSPKVIVTLEKKLLNQLRHYSQ